MSDPCQCDMTGRYPFRAFVSYAHEDRALAGQVVDALRSRGLDVFWDRDIRPGVPFTDAIKGLIAHAHVFVPIITDSSQKRPWVHQETGYAAALNIPVLPLALQGTVGGEMIAQLQAIIVQCAAKGSDAPDLLLADPEDLQARLLEVNFEQLVLPNPWRPRATIEVAEWPETRTHLLIQYARRVLEMQRRANEQRAGEALDRSPAIGPEADSSPQTAATKATRHGRLRQRAGLSSFYVPDKDIHDPIWERQEGSGRRSLYYRHLLREERRTLEAYARGATCDLIIDPASYFAATARNHRAGDEERTAGNRRLEMDQVVARVEELLAWLKSMPEDTVRVVMSQRASERNVVIVGDWFVAESLVRRAGESGYRQTVFHWHAPTVLAAIQRFDMEFEELAAEAGCCSRDAAVAHIERLLHVHALPAAAPDATTLPRGADA